MKYLFYTVLILITGAFQTKGQTNDSLHISNKNLSFTLHPVSGLFSIHDNKSDRDWSAISYKKVAFIKAEIVNQTQLRMLMHDSTSNINFSSLVSLDSDNSISFIIDTPQKDRAIDQLSFPPVIRTNYKEGSLVFCYRSGGVNLPQTEIDYPAKRMMVYDNIGLDMPWIGVYDGERGDGMMLLTDTPYDVELDLVEVEGKMWPGVAWASSLSTFAYPRKVSYVFTSSGKYNSQAKYYRNYMIEQGGFKSLLEKALDKPDVNKLKGTAIVWGSDGLNFARQANVLGVKSLMIMGNKFDLKDLREMTELGYLNSSYENLEGTREGPMGHMSDTMAIAAYHAADGKPRIGWVTKKGIEYYSRSSVRGLKAVKSYLPDYLEEKPLTGLFLDVTPAFLLEDYHPLHTFNRETDKNYKNLMNDYIGKDLRLVVGGEHGKAWSVAHLDYSEGPMTGSFFWEEGNKPGYLESPKDSTYMSQNFKKYGWSYQKRIPLWQLVFNDAVSSTWYWGDASGWFYEIDPNISDLKDNYNILYGTMPLMWADQRGYGWNRNRSRFIQTIRNVCNFQERVAFSELLNHQILNENSTLQYSKFKNGAEAYVSFSNQPISYKIGEKRVTLAPRGFYVTAPGFLQTKTVDKSGVVTKIVSDSLYSVTTDTYQKVGAVSTKGKITVFKVADNHWRIIAETPTSESVINLKELLKAKKLKPYSLTLLDENGNNIKTIVKNSKVKRLKVLSGDGIRIFDLNW